MFRKPLFTVIIAPKPKNSDAGSASKPNRSCDVLSITGKVKILGIIEIETKPSAEIARLFGKKESSILELMKNKEEVLLFFLLHRKLQQLLL